MVYRRLLFSLWKGTNAVYLEITCFHSRTRSVPSCGVHVHMLCRKWRGMKCCELLRVSIGTMRLIRRTNLCFVTFGARMEECVYAQSCCEAHGCQVRRGRGVMWRWRGLWCQSCDHAMSSGVAPSTLKCNKNNYACLPNRMSGMSCIHELAKETICDLACMLHSAFSPDTCVTHVSVHGRQDLIEI